MRFIQRSPLNTCENCSYIIHYKSHITNTNTQTQTHTLKNEQWKRFKQRSDWKLANFHVINRNAQALYTLDSEQMFLGTVHIKLKTQKKNNKVFRWKFIESLYSFFLFPFIVISLKRRQFILIFQRDFSNSKWNKKVAYDLKSSAWDEMIKI